MKKIFLILLISLSFAQANDLKEISLQLKWKYQFQFAGFIMAKEKGFYKDVGLNVELKELQSNTDIIGDVVHRKSNFGISDSSLVYDALHGKDVVAMMVVFQHSPFILLGLKHKTINKLEDVNNKKIALYQGIDGLSIKTMLKSNSINYIPKPPIFSLDKLLSGEVDLMSAYVSNEPYTAIRKKLDIITFAPEDYGFDSYGDILFTSKKMFKNNPEDVKKMYTASYRGWEYAWSHIEETVDVIYKKYNTQNKTKDALLFEAHKLKELSGYGENFGELNEEKIKGIAQLFNLMKNENNKLSTIDKFIYKHSKKSFKTVNVLFGYDKPPYIMGKTSASGIEPDVLKEAFANVNYKVNISQANKETLESILNTTTDIDAVATISPIDKKLFYSHPFSSYKNYVISRKKDHLKIKSLQDLKNIKFVTWLAAYNDLGDEFYRLFNPINGKYKKSYHETTSQKDDAAMFFSKKVDAIIVDETIFNWYKSVFQKDDEKYDFHDIFKKEKIYPVTFKNQTIRDDFNIGLDKLKQSGRYDEIINFYKTQNVKELLTFANVLSDISSKYIFENKKKKLEAILKHFFIHLDIQGISIKVGSETFINLRRRGKYIRVNNNSYYENSQSISKKIYYKNHHDILYLGKLVLHYKKSYQSKKNSLIPNIEEFEALKNDDYNYIKKTYKEHHLIHKKQLLTPKESQYIQEKKSVKVCVHKNQNPFVIFEKDGYSGISIEYLKKFTQKSSLKFQIIPSDTLQSHLAMLKNGKCDISAMVLTKPNVFDYLIPTDKVVSDNIVLVTKITEPYISDLNSLGNKKISIQKGANNLIHYVKSIYPHINLVEITGNDISRVATGEFYGHIGASYQLSYKIAKDYSDELKIMSKIGNTKINGSFGVTIREPILLNILNKLINHISTLEKQKIQNSWLSIKVEKEFDYTRLLIILLVALTIITILMYFILKQKKLEAEILEINNHLEEKVQIETEKNRQQELFMLQQNRLAQIGEMISMIAHQWRQPLNTLAMLNQTIILKHKLHKLDDALMDDFKVNSKKQIDQMSSTIDDFRNFFSPEKEKVNFFINEVVHHVLDILKPALESEKINITVQEEGSFSINGYPNELGQAILNIISNAKDALIENNIQSKQILISLQETENSIMLNINDNAGGIPEKIIDKIFDPYFSTKTEKNGTGLGLYMTKMIISEHMDGRLSVRNTQSGAQFSILLLNTT